MKNDILITNAVASLVILLGATCYFALKPNHKLVSANAPINIIVNHHGYQPALIQITAGKEINLHFVRENAEACKTAVEFPKFNAVYPFMLDIPINVILPAQTPGVIDFSCQGGTAHGRIVVV